MNILIAPNAFKNGLDAHAVAEAIAEGFKQSKLDCNCTLFPVGDGGDGTGSLIVQKLKGNVISVPVHDALGREITATFGLIDNGRTAVIEMADASGIRLLKTSELNAMQTTTIGTGELIKAALDKGATKIVIGMGGSATVDGGAGILSALGVRFLNNRGNLLKPMPADLVDLAEIDITAIDKRVLDCEIVILCDVDNKLLGGEGAATVFGPQKGASAADVIRLDNMLENLSALALQKTGRDMATIKHSGTAGGAAAALHAFFNAQLVGGANYFLELTHFNAALQKADMVITSEGSIDEQTLQGKAPAAVAAYAKQRLLPVIGLAGKVPLEHIDALDQYFDILLSINNQLSDLPTALKNTHKNLVRTARAVGDLLTLR